MLSKNKEKIEVKTKSFNEAPVSHIQCSTITFFLKKKSFLVSKN